LYILHYVYSLWKETFVYLFLIFFPETDHFREYNQT
jgi:hypothetical protein